MYKTFSPTGPLLLGVLIGHSRPVTSYVWTHDDTRLVTVGDDGAAIHWDLHKYGAVVPPPRPLHALHRTSVSSSTAPCVDWPERGVVGARTVSVVCVCFPVPRVFLCVCACVCVRGLSSLAKPTRVAESVLSSGHEFKHVAWSKEGVVVASFIRTSAAADVRVSNFLFNLCIPGGDLCVCACVCFPCLTPSHLARARCPLLQAPLLYLTRSAQLVWSYVERVTQLLALVAVGLGGGLAGVGGDVPFPGPQLLCLLILGWPSRGCSPLPPPPLSSSLFAGSGR